MVNLIVGPKGHGKTQEMIILANEKVKSSNGNVVFIKKSHRDTLSVDFNVRVICMDDYRDVVSAEEVLGFLYGMSAGNHDIEAVLMDGLFKLTNVTMETLPAFIDKLNEVSAKTDIDFYVSLSAKKDDVSGLNASLYKVLD